MSGRRRHLLTASGSWVLSLCNGAPRLPGHPGRRMLVSGRTLNTPRHVITNKPRDVFSERTVLCRDAFSALLAAGGTRAAGRTPGCASPSRVGGAHRPAPRRTEHKRAWRPSEPALPRLRCPSLRSTACACSHDTAVAFAFLLAAGRRHSWAPGWATGPRALAGSAVLGARRLHRPPVPTLPPGLFAASAKSLGRQNLRLLASNTRLFPGLPPGSRHTAAENGVQGPVGSALTGV